MPQQESKWSLFIMDGNGHWIAAGDTMRYAVARDNGVVGKSIDGVIGGDIVAFEFVRSHRLYRVVRSTGGEGQCQVS